MKNRKLILILSLVLALTMSLGGTLAYLTDTDSDVNTMTLGNVKIEQHEYERAIEDGTYKTTNITDNGKDYASYVLQAFTQDKMLLPIVGDPNEDPKNPAYAGFDENTTVRMSQVDSYGGMQVFAGKNAQDKFVTVENTGNTPAYVRTYVAIEVGSTQNVNPHAEGKALVMISNRAVKAKDVGTANDKKEPWIVTGIGIVEINGNNYEVREYLYRGANDVNRHVNGVLPAKDTTYPSLCQVYVKHQATNEDLQNLDGNKNDKLDIIVLSQAVQAEGFVATAEKSAAQVALEAGFGAAKTVNETTGNMNVVDWLAAASTQLPKVHQVSDAAGLKAAVAEGGVIYLDGTATFNDGRGDYLTVDSDATNVKIIGGTIEGYGHTGELRIAAQLDKGNIVFENVTFKIDNAPTDFPNWAMNVNISGTANVTFRNCTFTGVGCPIYQSGANTVVTIEDCTFEGQAIQAEIRSGDYELGQDLIIKNCDFGTIADVLHIYDYDKNPSTEAIVEYLKANGNTFTGVCKQTWP